MQTVPFHGAHQAGVATPPQAHLTLLGLDLHPGVGREGLGRLMSLLSDDASRLTRGLPALADTEPELAENPARLTVTFGFGPRLAAERFTRSGGRVTPLPAFRTDRLDPSWGQTDLAIQICADDPLTLTHARRMILKDSVDFARVRWVQDGFRHARSTVPDGTTMRNVMGQVDGTLNPVEAEPDFAPLIWSQESGFEGGTFMIVRRIRAEMEAWDKVDRVGREAAVGRRLNTGAPLTGDSEHDEPDFAATDRLGFPVIDPASHIARARTDDPAQRFLRRVFNYTVPDPTRPTGEDSGLVFIAFAADVERQFVPIQRRLAALDRLNEWVTTIGSAVYAVPPGAAEGRYVAQHLLTD
ncbi:Dyp-type peroxidase [Nocardioides sp.]|uniref:Dyp-type peroxidase n=1 Tax=Nocardioides sp. TaxID=35761 RepID=UPI003D0EB41C